ncbi:DnaJ-domain-containing protein [Hesseltinella vesiculosa]|uniref:Diphthamide biosynthesis protein 4 n=1 Tax=Hesseltinella vesiculosa TaxID=101127 RepID=A0A1X2G9R1_9FUNG|nr:DnaJ-domain-containing protein [Hesseltinella vesiculosa]
MESYYDVLNIPHSASTDLIKQRFQQLIMMHHPDKQQDKDTDDRAQQILRAWEVLRNADKRRAYDLELQLKEQKAHVVINEEVDLDDMEYDEDLASFSLVCRCSGVYVISEKDMELGMDTVGCDNCSLRIRVLYDIVDEDDQ